MLAVLPANQGFGTHHPSRGQIDLGLVVDDQAVLGDCLAQAMLPLIDDNNGELAAEQAKQLLAVYQPAYQAHYYQGMAAKLGLQVFREGDEDLFSSLFALMEKSVDFTIFFRRLSEIDQVETEAVLEIVVDDVDVVVDGSFVQPGGERIESQFDIARAVDRQFEVRL